MGYYSKWQPKVDRYFEEYLKDKFLVMLEEYVDLLLQLSELVCTPDCT